MAALWLVLLGACMATALNSDLPSIVSSNASRTFTTTDDVVGGEKHQVVVTGPVMGIRKGSNRGPMFTSAVELSSESFVAVTDLLVTANSTDKRRKSVLAFGTRFNSSIFQCEWSPSTTKATDEVLFVSHPASIAAGYSVAAGVLTGLEGDSSHLLNVKANFELHNVTLSPNAAINNASGCIQDIESNIVLYENALFTPIFDKNGTQVGEDKRDVGERSKVKAGMFFDGVTWNQELSEQHIAASLLLLDPGNAADNNSTWARQLVLWNMTTGKQMWAKTVTPFLTALAPGTILSGGIDAGQIAIDPASGNIIVLFHDYTFAGFAGLHKVNTTHSNQDKFGEYSVAALFDGTDGTFLGHFTPPFEEVRDMTVASKGAITEVTVLGTTFAVDPKVNHVAKYAINQTDAQLIYHEQFSVGSKSSTLSNAVSVPSTNCTSIWGGDYGWGQATTGSVLDFPKTFFTVAGLGNVWEPSLLSTIKLSLSPRADRLFSVVNRKYNEAPRREGYDLVGSLFVAMQTDGPITHSTDIDGAAQLYYIDLYHSNTSIIENYYCGAHPAPTIPAKQDDTDIEIGLGIAAVVIVSLAFVIVIIQWKRQKRSAYKPLA